MGLEHSEIQREPARGFHLDPAAFAGLSGFEQTRVFTDGRALPPPVGYLYGLRVHRVEHGAVSFTMPASPWLLPPQGIISGSALALLVDGPLGCTIQTSLPAATPYTTSELSLQFLRPVVADGGTLTCAARQTHSGRRLAMSEGTVTDATGKVVALASTRCVVLPTMPLEPSSEEIHLPQLEEPAWPSPHPYQRPVVGAPLPQETWDRLSGLDIMRRLMTGALPAPPICGLLGVWPVAAEEGGTTWTMPATAWMQSPVEGRLYGGVTAFLAGNAIDGAFQTMMPPGTAFATLDLKVYLLRPVPPDNRDLTAVSRVVHRGRQLCIGTSEVTNADGKLVAMATASAMVLPGRPAIVARAVEEDMAPA